MRRKRVDPTGLLIAVGVHVVVLLALLAHHPTRQRLAQVAPLVVKLITPAPPQVAPPPPPPALRTPPRLTAPTMPRLDLPPAAFPLAESPHPDAAPSALGTAPQSTAAPEPSTTLPTAVAVTPPTFNADYLENPAPAYPGPSRRLREQGRVILRVLVRTNGTAAQVQVRTSSGYVRLDDAARDAVAHWKFVPAKRGAEPVEEWVLVPVSFRLES